MKRFLVTLFLFVCLAGCFAETWVYQKNEYYEIAEVEELCATYNVEIGDVVIITDEDGFHNKFVKTFDEDGPYYGVYYDVDTDAYKKDSLRKQLTSEKLMLKDSIRVESRKTNKDEDNLLSMYKQLGELENQLEKLEK